VSERWKRNVLLEGDDQRSFSTKIVFEVLTLYLVTLQLALATHSEVLGLPGWLIHRNIRVSAGV
jgi:hypothetical protein